jgi:hypothetical protein
MAEQSIIVVDNIYDKPQEIRELALSLEFSAKPAATYPGKPQQPAATYPRNILARKTF